MTHAFPTLETERLILRVPDARDLEAHAAFMADPEATRHLGGTQHPGQSWRTLATLIGAWHLRGFAFFSVIRRDTGEWIGRVGPWYPEQWPGTEVGWGIAPAHQRLGFAREAALASMDFAFEKLAWDRVIHVIAPGNTASIAVARSVGSEHLDHLPRLEPFGIAVDIFGQTRERWYRSNRRGSR